MYYIRLISSILFPPEQVEQRTENSIKVF